LVISTFPRCHLDRRERSHAAIIRSGKGILGNMRFLASLRNDSEDVIKSFALPGKTRFLASARNDRKKKRNDSSGYLDLPPLVISTFNLVIATFLAVHLDHPPLSSRP